MSGLVPYLHFGGDAAQALRFYHSIIGYEG